MFMPKIKDTKSPVDLRPISISSIFLRHFHRRLNNRLISIMPFSFGFQSMDSIGHTIEELESVFMQFKSKFNPLSAAFTDLRKAFDLVNFDAIYDALQWLGVPISFINYIRFLHANARMFFIFDGNVSDPVHPSRGFVKATPSRRHFF